MQLIRCSVCRKRPVEVPMTIFWSWRAANGARIALRQRVCLECYTLRLVLLNLDEDAEELHCPLCGIVTENDYLPVYASVFKKKAGREDWSLPLCSKCFDSLRQFASEGSESLPDRDVGAADSAPTYSAEATFAALGREDPHLDAQAPKTRRRAR